MKTSQRMLLRVWLPDRPGALGALTTRLGAVGADVAGLEVVERGGGQAIDELVIDVPAEVSTGLLVREITAEDDVTVEELRTIDRGPFDAHLDALDAVTAILDAKCPVAVAETLCLQVGHYVRASWAVVINERECVLASAGSPPSPAWLAAFTCGSPTLFDDAVADEIDTVWVPLDDAGARLVVGRDAAFRARERQRVAGLAVVADRWFRAMAHTKRLESMRVHPAGSAR